MASNRGVAYIEPGKVEVRSIEYPKLKMPAAEDKPFGGKDAPHGVILKIVSTNICGSDQHSFWAMRSLVRSSRRATTWKC
jgi:glutathione-independent formaldehyde dehydrogenase